MSNAYVIKFFRAPESVYVANTALIGHHVYETRHFFNQVYFSQRLEPSKSVPISYELIKKEWGRNNVHWEKLLEEGLLRVETFSIDKKLSYRFSLTPEAFEHLNKAWPTQTKDYELCEGYNLITGKKMKSKGHILSKEDGKPLPPLIKLSMQSIKYGLFNDTAIADYFAQRWPNGLPPMTNETERARYYVDRCSYDSLRLNDIEATNQPGIYKYKPAFQVQYTGRITEVGRGLQSCSRQMKHAAFKDLKDIHNYDLESAQIWVLVQFFEFANIPATWLTTYLTSGKQPYYNAVGLDKDTWKRCLISLILGSSCPKTLCESEQYAHKSAIVQYILEYNNNFTNLAKPVVEAFYRTTLPLHASMNVWYKWLLNSYITMSGVAQYGKGKHYVANFTGMTFCISDYKTKDGKFKNVEELKRKLGAFFLQGGEAAFIHHLTAVQEHFGFHVLSNQHDGLVTQGTIPQEAIDIAKQNSGLRYATLIEKPFV